MSVPRPGAHGGDSERVARALGLDPGELVDLSISMNPFAPDIAALASRHLGALRRYPDRAVATAQLAEAMEVDADQLVLTNGGSEAISLVAAALGGGAAAEPEFALHPRSPSGPRWRSNPHNPTGRLAAADETADVWDEAFYPLATGRWTRRDTGPVVVGSLTKVFACPGLRLGYVLSPDAARLAAGQPGWPVSSLALAVLPDMLLAADLSGWQRRIVARRQELVDLLARHGLGAEQADAPWVLVSAPGLRERLAPHGVLVRDCTSFGLPGWARLGLPDDRGLHLLDGALTRSSA